MLGPELASLELDDHVAAQPQVVEEQIEIEVLAADLEMNLPADEGEASSELEEKLRDVLDERSLELDLAGFLADAEEVEVIGVLETFACEIGLRFREALGKVGERPALAVDGPRLDVVCQDGARPPTLEGARRVRQAGNTILELREEDQIVASGQLSNRLLDKVGFRPGLREGAHVHQIRARKPLHVGERDPEVGRQLVDDASPPPVSLLPFQDVAPELPVERK
jgi:hypothetical protein